MRCEGCGKQVSWSPEILGGRVIGICPHCGYRKGDNTPNLSFKPDPRGAPSRPGG